MSKHDAENDILELTREFKDRTEEVKGLAGDVRKDIASVRAEVTELAQKAMRRGSDSSYTRGASESIGEMFVKSFAENADMFGKTRSLRLTVKAAGDAVTTAMGRSIESMGAIAPAANLIGFQYSLPTRGIAPTSAVEYSRFDAQEGTAAVQVSEGASKSYVRGVHSLVMQPTLTVAGLTKISKQAMSDTAELRQACDTTLMRAVAKSLDSTLTAGASGFTGYVALADAFTSATYTRIADATSEAVAAMQLGGFAPDVVIMSPATWLSILVAQGTDGQYLSGNYLNALPLLLRGMRVVLSAGVAANKSIVIDSVFLPMMIAEGFDIEVGFVNDDFEKNLCTLRGEMRIVPTYRAVGSVRLVTPKP